MPEPEHVYVVAIDAFSVQGKTYRRGDRLTRDQVGHQLAKFLNAGLVVPASSETGPIEPGGGEPPTGPET